MLKIGHRGAPGYPRVAENTLGSFKRAIWKSANALEFDVRRAKDGKLVVIHDLSVHRTTSGSGNVCDLTYKQLYELDAGFGEKIPLLETVLRNFSTQAFLNIEIKEAGIEEEILRLINFYKAGDRVLVSAFDSDDNDSDSNSSWEQLKIFESNGILIALLATQKKIKKMGGWLNYLTEAVARKAFAVSPEDHYIISSEMIRQAHGLGLLVNLWTVNSFLRIQALKILGVDGIISDFPERL